MINWYSLIIASSISPWLLLHSWRVCINDVTQLCHITRVYSRPLTLVGSLVIIFFILNYLLCPRWSSYLEVDLPFSLGHIMILIFFWIYFFHHVSLTMGASGSSSCILFIGMNLEPSSLVLWNKSRSSFLVGDCTWYFLQVKYINCMVRKIS